MKEFLEKLENRIYILEKEERDKIIKKYQKEIEKKIKDGMNEEEAINSLKDLDEIVSEIYAEYHININHNTSKKTLGKKIDDIINSCAKFLTEFCHELIEYAKKNTGDKPLETFFEVVLKILLLILAFMFLKLPFILIEEIFIWIFDLLFYPFNVVLIAVLEFILAVIYLICCIILGIAMFKNYYKKDSFEKNKRKDDDSKSKEEEIIKVFKPESSKELRNYTFAFLKSLLYIIVIIPMVFLNLIFFILALFAGFLVFKGVNIVGLSIVLIGLFLLTVVITNYVTDALDGKNKSHIFSLCISVIAIIIGSLLFIDNLLKFNYPSDLEKSIFYATIETNLIEIEKETTINSVDGSIEYVIDNELKDNEILVEIIYYDEFTDVFIDNYRGKENDYILIYPLAEKYTAKNVIYFYNNVLEDLKKDNIYNYQDLKKFNATIYCNENTKELLK